jgi:penicillin-binding protein 2
MNPAKTDPGKTPDYAPRLRIVVVTFAVTLLVLVACLGYQQLLRSADHTAREQRQSQRRILSPAPRGVIYDREHRILAGNRLRTDAVINLGYLRGQTSGERLAAIQRQVERVNALTGRQEQVDAARLERAFARDRLAPFVLADDLNEAEAVRLAGGLAAADPVRLMRSSQRWYPHGTIAVHVLGRVRREVTGTPASGLGGLEQQYDARLRGRPGEALMQVDAWGFPLDPLLAHSDAVPGEDLVLSLDVDLQLATERAMAATSHGPRGAAVLLSIATGEVLALASKPGFDLNEVSPVLTPATKQRIDAAGGWFNRAVQGLYPPGSTFKMFTAVAGLRGGTLRPDTTQSCPGFLDVGGHRFPCHHAAGHGRLALRDALAHSCNVFAYQTGLAAGPAALAAEARRFHFASPTGINLPAETSRMLVPDPAWKEEAGRGNWTPGDTVNLSIGQGFLRCSPLQMACAVASLARRETLTVPTLLRQPGRSPAGDRPREPLGLADGDYAALIQGLRAVIETGIGRDAQVPGVSMAGKTGTAQIARPEGSFNVAWFVAFAPVENPEIAIVVAMEGDQPGVEFAGAEHSAPIVREIVGTYFDKRAGGTR